MIRKIVQRNIRVELAIKNNTCVMNVTFSEKTTQLKS